MIFECAFLLAYLRPCNFQLVSTHSVLLIETLLGFISAVCCDSESSFCVIFYETGRLNFGANLGLGYGRESRQVTLNNGKWGGGCVPLAREMNGL